FQRSARLSLRSQIVCSSYGLLGVRSPEPPPEGAALVFLGIGDRRKFCSEIFERYSPRRIYLPVVSIVLVRRCKFVVLTVCLVLGQRAASQGRLLCFPAWEVGWRHERLACADDRG